jgi:hypothetical protein
MSEQINLILLDAHTCFIDGIDNELVAKEIEQFSGQVPDIKDPHPAHTFYEDKYYPYEKPECAKLLKKITETVNVILAKEMVIDSAWTLTLERGQSVVCHTHKVNTQLFPLDYYSISYYVNAPSGSAELIFLTQYCNTVENATSIKPQTGMLTLFNSFIPHMTNRHYSDEKRIVISANLRPLKENLTISPDWSEYEVPKITLKD